MYQIFKVCTEFPGCCLAVSHSGCRRVTLMLQLCWRDIPAAWCDTLETDSGDISSRASSWEPRWPPRDPAICRTPLVCGSSRIGLKADTCLCGKLAWIWCTGTGCTVSWLGRRGWAGFWIGRRWSEACAKRQKWRRTRWVPCTGSP